MTPKLFSELGLSPEIQKAIDKLGFEQASPIQAESIPVLLQGSDIVGQSQTGSGKTAAFAIPAIEKVDPGVRAVQVLVLCPTRELAVQVAEEVHKLSLFKRGVHALPIYGGQSFERQLYGLRQGAQIVIGTPGRVMDHMRRGTLRLDSVRLAILDEADVMLNMGFRDDIETILQATPAGRQTVFFSATVPRPIQELIQKYSKDPKNIRIEQKALTVPTVEQVYYEVDRRFKVELLTRLIDIHDLKLGIIFCNTKRAVDDLVEHLNAQGYSADRLHGDMNQTMRDRVMNRFRKSGLEFLVATDVAARGIDVDDVQVVFNFDLPYDVEDYVHRIGRTGRAGRSGMAISFAAGREVFQIRNIERFTRVRIQRGRAPSAGEVEEARVSVFLDKLRGTLRSGDFKRQDHLVERLLEEGFTSTDIASALLHMVQETSSASSKSPAERMRAARSEPVAGPARTGPGIGPSGVPGRPPVRSTTPSKAAAPQMKVAGAGVRAVPARPVEKEPGEHGEPGEPGEHGSISVSVPVASPSESAPPVASEPTPAGDAPASAPPATGAEGVVRLWMSAGAHLGLDVEELAATIMGETGLRRSDLLRIDLWDRHSIVEVSKAHAGVVLTKMKRTPIMGRRLKIKPA
ncbi:MAG: DEAD/DEAH box helicase [Limisphaerales bacterium]